MKCPLLSVIIPCYNNGKYLLKMIDCFRHQTSDDWELIVVDDGSTDDTPQVVENTFCDLPNAYFYRRDRLPKGSVVCRNIGFEHAKGKYVCHLDADDLVSNNFVERRVAFMENNLAIDYASFPAIPFRDEQHLPTKFDRHISFGIDKGYNDVLESFLREDYCFSVWNNIYRRDSILDMNWDENVKIYTDFSFIVPGILKGLKHAFYQSKEYDYYYRVGHSSNVMTSSFVSEDKHKSSIYLFSKTLDSLTNRDDFGIRKEQYLQFVTSHFARLLFYGNISYLEQYVDMLSAYYDKLVISKFRNCYKALRHSKTRLKIIHIYASLYINFKYPIYRTYLIHSLIKAIIRK